MTDSFSLETELIYVVKLVHLHILHYIYVYFNVACINNSQKSVDAGSLFVLH